MALKTAPVGDKETDGWHNATQKMGGKGRWCDDERKGMSLCVSVCLCACVRVLVGGWVGGEEVVGRTSLLFFMSLQPTWSKEVLLKIYPRSWCVQDITGATPKHIRHQKQQHLLDFRSIQSPSGSVGAYSEQSLPCHVAVDTGLEGEGAGGGEGGWVWGEGGGEGWEEERRG